MTKQRAERAGSEGGEFKLTVQIQNYDHCNGSGMCAETVMMKMLRDIWGQNEHNWLSRFRQ